jgi:hypothetical protein
MATEQDATGVLYGDSGGASRFFYCAKTSRRERNAGLEGFEEVAGPDGNYRMKAKNLTRKDQGPAEIRPTKNGHPTVKPISSTGCAAALEGFDFIGCERKADYIAIAEARIAFWSQHVGREIDDVLGLVGASERERRRHLDLGQGSIFDHIETEKAEVA